jgi:putative DNA primase/helicase
VTLDEFVAFLDGSNGAYRCPAHEDVQASLSVSDGQRGILLKCHAGCSSDDVLKALGLTYKDLFTEEPPSRYPEKREVIATYDYTDESGAPLYQVRRYVPKHFTQHAWDGAGWAAKLGAVRRVPYHLPALVAAGPDRWIFIVEGEADVLSLEEQGFVATTVAGGAGGWSDSFCRYFTQRRVAILPDNDDPGRDYARRVGSDLQGTAKEIRLVALPGVPKKGDVTDYFIRGGTREELISLVKAAPGILVPLDVVPSGPLRVTVASDIVTKPTTWLWPGRIPLGKITIIDGNPGQGKSALTMHLVSVLSQGDRMPEGSGLSRGCLQGHCIVLNAEDDPADTIVPRLEAAGADLTRVSLVGSVRPLEGPERPWELPGDLEYLRELIVGTDAKLVVIDPLMAFLSDRTSGVSDQQVRRALHPLKELASDTGAAIVLVRHLRKSAEGPAVARGGGSIGIIGAARSGLVVAPNPDYEDERVVAVSKLNVGKPGRSLRFRLTGDPVCVEWLGTSPYSADELLSPRKEER